MSSPFDVFDTPLPIPTPEIGGLPSSVPAMATFSPSPGGDESSSVAVSLSSVPGSLSSVPASISSPMSVGASLSSPIGNPTSSSGFPSLTMSFGSSVPGAGMNSNGQPYATGEVTMSSGGGSGGGGGGANAQHKTRTSTAGAPGEIKNIGTTGVVLALMMWLAAFVA